MAPSFLSSPVQDWPASKLSRSTRDSAEREREFVLPPPPHPRPSRIEERKI